MRATAQSWRPSQADAGPLVLQKGTDSHHVPFQIPDVTKMYYRLSIRTSDCLENTSSRFFRSIFIFNVADCICRGVVPTFEHLVKGLNAVKGPAT
jgi:hypothetical protein